MAVGKAEPENHVDKRAGGKKGGEEEKPNIEPVPFVPGGSPAEEEKPGEEEEEESEEEEDEEEEEEERPPQGNEGAEISPPEGAAEGTLVVPPEEGGGLVVPPGAEEGPVLAPSPEEVGGLVVPPGAEQGPVLAPSPEEVGGLVVPPGAEQGLSNSSSKQTVPFLQPSLFTVNLRNTFELFKVRKLVHSSIDPMIPIRSAIIIHLIVKPESTPTSGFESSQYRSHRAESSQHSSDQFDNKESGLFSLKLSEGDIKEESFSSPGTLVVPPSETLDTVFAPQFVEPLPSYTVVNAAEGLMDGSSALPVEHANTYGDLVVPPITPPLFPVLSTVDVDVTPAHAVNSAVEPVSMVESQTSPLSSQKGNFESPLSHVSVPLRGPGTLVVPPGIEPCTKSATGMTCDNNGPLVDTLHSVSMDHPTDIVPERVGYNAPTTQADRVNEHILTDKDAGIANLPGAESPGVLVVPPWEKQLQSSVIPVLFSGNDSSTGQSGILSTGTLVIPTHVEPFQLQSDTGISSLLDENSTVGQSLGPAGIGTLVIPPEWKPQITVPAAGYTDSSNENSPSSSIVQNNLPNMGVLIIPSGEKPTVQSTAETAEPDSHGPPLTTTHGYLPSVGDLTMPPDGKTTATAASKQEEVPPGIPHLPAASTQPPVSAIKSVFGTEAEPKLSFVPQVPSKGSGGIVFVNNIDTVGKLVLPPGETLQSDVSPGQFANGFGLPNTQHGNQTGFGTLVIPPGKESLQSRLNVIRQAPR